MMIFLQFNLSGIILQGITIFLSPEYDSANQCQTVGAQTRCTCPGSVRVAAKAPNFAGAAAALKKLYRKYLQKRLFVVLFCINNIK